MDRTLLASGTSAGLRGEASVGYSDPALTPVVARRLRETNADVRLLFVVRHPIERLRSHYRELVQRAVERRPIADAVSEPNNVYLRRSLYSRTLAAIDDVFDRKQLLVVLSERLDEDDTWREVLEHLALRPVPRPIETYNVTAEKDGFTPAMHKLWEIGLLDRAKGAPKPVRRVARKVLMRRGPRYEAMLAESNSPIPESVVLALEADAQQFTGAMNWPECPWTFPTSATLP